MGGELLVGPLSGPDLPEQFYDSTGDFGRHGGPALDGLPQTLKQSGRRCFLEQVAAGASAQGLKYAVVIIVDREHEQCKSGELLLQQTSRFDSAHSRQPNVCQYDMRQIVAEFFY